MHERTEIALDVHVGHFARGQQVQEVSLRGGPGHVLLQARPMHVGPEALMLLI